MYIIHTNETYKLIVVVFYVSKIPKKSQHLKRFKWFLFWEI